MTIVITGGSGFIGTELTRVLLGKGHTVIVIDKRGPSLIHQNLFYIPCDLETSTLPFNVLERTDAIVNLAGRTISGKWNEAFKKQIADSRIISTRNLIHSLEQTVNKPPIVISASAVGYYGENGDVLLDERTPKGAGFLSDVTDAWEKEALKAEEFGCRVVIVRTAIVIGKGGFMTSLWKLARFHVAVSIFKKDFWMPWVHINDIVRIYMFALETNTLQGVVNAVALEHTRYSEFMKTFKKETKSLLIKKVPLLKLFLGDLPNELATSQKILPQRLSDKGFEFAFTNIAEAIHSIKKHEEN